jgi:hypothetical protein
VHRRPSEAERALTTGVRQIGPLRKPTASDSCYAPRVAGGTFAGMAAKVQEHNLAVFGESGSGKTVLLSLSPLIVGLLFRPGP